MVRYPERHRVITTPSAPAPRITATLARNHPKVRGTSTARLLQALLDAGLGQFEPNPLQALERAEQRQPAK
jgi:hypothetical protein